MKQAYSKKTNTTKVFTIRILTFLMLGFFGFNAQSQSIVYVDSAANPGGDGSSWAMAYDNLIEALDPGNYNDGDTVWVARGTYFPDTSALFATLPNRNASFFLRRNLAIYGGFDSGAVSLTQRDFITKPTILSGNIGLAGVDTDNSFNVVTSYFTDSSAVLNGFIITKGYANDTTSSSTPFVVGGGMLCPPGGPINDGSTIRNCVFKDNFAQENGGAVYADNNNPIFFDCVFLENVANEGGGVFLRNNRDVVFKDCYFQGNRASSYGGAMALFNTSPHIVRSLFYQNIAILFGGAIDIRGGSSPEIVNCQIRGNQVNDFGGGISAIVGSRPKLINCIISGNQSRSRSGGGLYFEGPNSRIDILNCTFSGNFASGRGGGIYQAPSGVSLILLENTILWENGAGIGSPYQQQYTANQGGILRNCIIQNIPNGAGVNSFHGDPLFLNPILASAAPTIAGDFHTSLYSPVINRGDNLSLPVDITDVDEDGNTFERIGIDLDQKFRIENDTVDIGPYESLSLCIPLGRSRLFFPDGPVKFCDGDSVKLFSRPFLTYLWSNGSTDSSITIYNTDTVTLTVTDTTGCTGAGTLIIEEIPFPTPQITPDPAEVCIGDTLSLSTAIPYALYQWSTGSDSAFTLVTTADTIYVTVTNSTGCSASDTSIVSLNIPIPFRINIISNDTICEGETVRLVASPGFITYTWSTGETTRRIDVDTSGVYIANAVDANGCKVSDTVTIVVLPNPIVDILASDTVFCQGGSVLLDAGSGFVSYLWNPGGENSQVISVFTAGNYKVTVTDTNSCSALDSILILSNPKPIVDITPNGDTLFCAGDSVDLSSSLVGTYLWSTGETSRTIRVDTTGIYTLYFTDNKDCRDTSFIQIESRPLPRLGIVTSGSTTFCAGGSVLLVAQDTGHVSDVITWSTGEVRNRISVVSSGNYIATVVDNLGCTAKDSITVTVHSIPAPSISTSGPTTFCDGDSVILDAGSYAHYNWSTTDTSQQISVKNTMLVTVTVTDSNGCTGSNLIQITVNPRPHIDSITVSGPTTFCDGGSVLLSAGIFFGYTWSPSNAASSSITATQSGNYEVIVSNLFGCTDTATKLVTVHSNPIVNITPLGSTTICHGDSLELDAGAGYSSYLWSTTDTNETIVVNTAGIFSVTVTDSNGCTDIDSIEAFTGAALTPQIVTSSGRAVLCTGDSLVLSVSGTFATYLWNSIDPNPTIKIHSGGKYYVDVSVANGCTGSDTIQIADVPLANPQILASSSTTFCDGDSVSLYVGKYSSYLWSTTVTDSVTTVYTTGTYSISVVDSNGCKGNNTIDITANPIPAASITTSGLITFCDGDSVILYASQAAGYTYTWTPSGQNDSLTAKISGVYKVVIENTFGCTDSAETTVTVNPNPQPNIIILGSSSFCEGNSTILDAGSFPTSFYDWTKVGGGPSLGSTRFLTVTTTGDYIIKVTNANGCIGNDTVSITVHSNPIPVVQTVGGGTDFCEGITRLLSVQNGPYNNYLWSNGSTANTLLVDTSAIYWVRVTDANNCRARDSIQITVFPNPTPSISVTDTAIFCEGDSATLDAGLYALYQWNTGESSRRIVVDSSDTYLVTVVDNNQCLGFDSVQVIVFVNPVLNIQPSGPIDLCAGDSVILNGGTHLNYLWSTGDIDSTIIVKSSGIYKLEVSNGQNCSAKDSVIVNVHPNPNPQIIASGPISFCENDSVVLTLNQRFTSYLWSNGDATSSITVDTSGTFIITVMDSNGCTGSDTIIITVYPNPDNNILPAGPLAICFGTSVTLDAGVHASYLWSTTATTRRITVATTSTVWVEVTSNQGCKAKDTVQVNSGQNVFPQIISSPALMPVCEGQTVTLETTVLYKSYLWSTGDTTRRIIADTAGTYTVVIEDFSGCQGGASFSVTTRPNPIPTITTLDTTIICGGDSATLDAGNYVQYFWNNGQTTRVIEAKTDGDHIVSVVDIHGCTAQDTFNITVHPVPLVGISASGGVVFCYGDSVTLTTLFDPTFRYQWSSSLNDTLNFIVVKSLAIYSVTVTDTNQCQNSDVALVTVYPQVIVQIVNNGSNSLCQGDTAMLDAGAFDSYLWSTGDTSQTILVDTTGWYRVSVVDSNGCLGVDSIRIQVNPNPNISISPTGPLDLCVGDSVLVTVLGLPHFTYQWSGGETGNPAYLQTAGWNIVTVTDTSSCATKDSIFINLLSLPTPMITALDTVICPGGTMDLDAGAGYVTYLWNSSASTQIVTVNAAGTHNVIVTDSNGCKGIDQIITTTSSALSINISPSDTTVCGGDSVILSTALPYASYQWSSNVNDTLAAVTIGVSGTISLIVRDADGCLGYDTTQILHDTLPVPQISALGPLTFCLGDSVKLQGTSGFSTYAWTPSGGNSIQATARTAGTHRLTVTDGNGCIGSDSIDVFHYPQPVPSIVPDGPTSVCGNDSVGLSLDSTYVLYSWFKNGVLISNSSSIVAKTTGIFKVIVSNSDGCLGIDSIQIDVGSTLNPVITSSIGSAFLCDNTVSDLYPGLFHSYLWTGAGTTAADTLATLRVGVQPSGIYQYYVLVSDADGCVGRDTIDITILPPLSPTIFANGPTAFCNGDSVALDAGGPYTQYLWTNGDTTQQTVIKNLGLYRVDVVDIYGCQGNASRFVDVFVNPNLQITPNSTNPSFCDGDSLLLYGGVYSSMNWSSQTVNPLGLDSTIIVRGTDTYYLAIIDSNGCKANDSFFVQFYNNPIPNINPLSGKRTLCPGDTFTLDAGLYNSYFWSVSGQNNQLLSDTVAGIYAVRVTDGNGCIGTDSFEVKAVSSPIALIVPDSIPQICEGGIVNLNAGTGFQKYLWIDGDTTQIIQADTGKIYTVRVTDQNGCKDSDSIEVIQFINPSPVITTSNGLPNSCTADSISLLVGNYAKYQWANGDTTPTILADTGVFNYFVTVWDTNGCAGNNAIGPILVELSPQADFNGLDTAYCSNDNPVTLVGLPNGGVFSGPGVISNSFDPSLAQVGLNNIKYIYTDTSTLANCIDSFSRQVNIFPFNLHPTISNISNLECDGAGAIQLYAILQTGDTLSGGQFIGPGIYGSTFVPDSVGPGTYQLKYRFSGGVFCADSVFHTVTVNPVAPISIIGLPDTLCVNGSPISFSGVAPSGGFAFGPNNSVNPIPGNNAFRFFPAVADTGLHDIVFSYNNGNNCFSEAVKPVYVLPIPQVTTQIPDTSFCKNNNPVLLQGLPGGGTFTSNTAIISSNTLQPSLTAVGRHILSYDYVSNNGCRNFILDTVWIDSVPNVSLIGLQSPYCRDGDPDTLTGLPLNGIFSGAGITDSIFNPMLAGPGNHDVQYYFMDAEGCSDSVSIPVHVDAATVLIFGSDTSHCLQSVGDTLKANPSGGSFSGPGVYNGLFFADSVGTGTFTIIYSYNNPNGCEDLLFQDMTVDTMPIVSMDTLLQPRYCIHHSAITLTGQPAGGVFVGRTIVSGTNIFDPSNQGTGIFGKDTITYTFVDGNGCSDVVTKEIEILPPPVANIIGASDTIEYKFCQNGVPIQLVGSPASGTFVLKGDTLAGGIFDPAQADTSVINVIKYVVDDGIGCSDTALYNAFVVPSVEILFVNLDSAYCDNSGNYSVTAQPVGGQIFIDGNATSVLNTNTLSAGWHTVSVIRTNPGDTICTDTFTQQLRIRPLPQVAFSGLSNRYCALDSIVLLIPSPPGGYFLGPGIIDSTNKFDPRLAASDTVLIKYIYADDIGCVDTAKLSTYILKRPDPNFSTPVTCFGYSTNFQALDPAASSMSFSWYFGDGDSLVGNVPNPGHFYQDVGSYDVHLKVKLGENCSSDTTISAFVRPSPVADFVGDSLAFLGDTIHLFNNSMGEDLYEWNMGDGNSLFTEDVTHLYRDTGNYQVIFIAKKNYPDKLCSDTAYGKARIIFRPIREYELTVYPNPTTGNLFVNVLLDGGEDVSLQLYDMQARVVRQQNYPELKEGLNKLEFSLAGLAEGYYVVSIIAAEGLLKNGAFEPGVFSRHKLRYNKRLKVRVIR